MIDTSIDRDHPAFDGRNIEISNFLPSGAARTVNWHGTGVLAVLAGSPDSGTPGLVPDAHFLCRGRLSRRRKRAARGRHREPAEGDETGCSGVQGQRDQHEHVGAR